RYQAPPKSAINFEPSAPVVVVGCGPTEHPRRPVCYATFRRQPCHRRRRRLHGRHRTGGGPIMPYARDPGSKASGTSEDAAQAITSHANNLRDRALAFFTDQYPASFTADQVAAALGENILTVRPRVSE